jgi:hypothetical protein
MDTIRKISGVAMTLYYKGFRPDDGPLRIEHFVFLCLAADLKLKQDEYDRERNIQIRAKTAIDISMSAENYDTVEVPIKNNKIKLPNPIMSFSGDKGTVGVNNLSPVGQCPASFMRINSDEQWTVCNTKDVVFWFINGQCIEFINLGTLCNPETIRVTYIPQLSEKSTVQGSRKWSILNMVTQFIKAAENGTIIDMSNDGNSNVASQTEINKYILKALQK